MKLPEYTKESLRKKKTYYFRFLYTVKYLIKIVGYLNKIVFKMFTYSFSEDLSTENERTSKN